MKREGLATHTRGRHEQHGSPQEWRERRRGRGKFDLKLEVVLIPVSDVDRSKKFYEDLGWTLDADFGVGEAFRIVQFTPPGSGCSTGFGKGVTPAAPGSAKGLELIVSDIVAVRAELAERGLDVSEVFHGSPFSSAGRISGRTPSGAATSPTPPSRIRMATCGCSRKSRCGCPVASIPPSRRSCPWRIWPARRDVDAHLLLPLQVARNAAGRVRPGGTLLFMSGTVAAGRRRASRSSRRSRPRCPP